MTNNGCSGFFYYFCHSYILTPPIMRIGYIVLISLGISTTAYGANKITLNDSIPLNEVVVTGSQTKVSRNNIPMTVSVVSRKQLAETDRATILPALSEQIPGLFVTERGMAGYGVSNGSAGAITIRGIGSAYSGGNLINTQVLFLIDGHPQYMGLMGHHLPDALVSANVERVEVIRGPASMLYGSNAMGGAVNIITRNNQQNGFHAGAEGSYGSYETYQYAAHAMYKADKWDLFASSMAEHTDGHRPNSHYENTGGYIKARYRVSPHFTLSGDFGLNAYKAFDPGTITSPLTDNWVDVLRGSASLMIENRFNKTSGAIKLFNNFGDHDIFDGYHSTDQLTGANLFQSYSFFTGNQVTLGGDFKYYGGKARNTLLVSFLQKLMNFPLDTTVFESAGYLSFQQTLFNNLLTFNTGVRYENSSIYGGEWIPQAGLAFRPFTYTVFKASVAKGFRSPTIKELFLFPPRNPNLKPERMVNYELSWLQKWHYGKISTEITLFNADGENIIVQSNPSVRSSPLVNAGTFHQRGVEATVDYTICKKLSLTANYSFLDMETPVLAAPKHQFFAAMSFQPVPKFSFRISAQRIEKLYLQTDANTTTTSYTLLNARAAYIPFPEIEFFVNGNNLLDTGYENNFGYPLPRTNVKLGLKVAF